MVSVKIPLLIIDIISTCNLNCRHCLNRPHYQHTKTLNYEQIKLCVDKCIPHGVNKICLSGGEPFLHPHIIDIIKSFRFDYPEIELVIATNGTLLTEEIIKKLDDIGGITLQISVDGSNKEIYESIRGHDTYKNFRYGFNALCKSKNNNKTARNCINAFNYKDIANIYEICINNNIAPSFIIVSEMGNAALNWNTLSLNVSQQLYVIDKINYLNKKYNQNVPSPMPCYKCNFTSLALKENIIDLDRWGLSVNVEGNVSCCQYLYDHPIGNIFKESIIEMFESEVFKHYLHIAQERYAELTKDSVCTTCSLINSCEFGCIGLAESYGNIHKTDHNCLYRKAFALSKAMKFIN